MMEQKKNYPENLLKLKTVVLLNVMRLFVSDECFIHFFYIFSVMVDPLFARVFYVFIFVAV